MLRLKLAQVTM